jgi:type I restriction enzyme S subunit
MDRMKATELPSKWKLHKLRALGSPFNGLSGKSKEDFGSGKPYIPYMNIFRHAIIKEDAFDYVTIKEDEQQNRVNYGDLFFTTSSETPYEVGMSSAYLGKNPELYLNSFCFGFRLNDFQTALPDYLSYYFRSSLGRRFMSRLAQGATRYNLSKNLLLKEEIPLPPTFEQRKIAEILSTWDLAISTTQKLIDEIKLRNKGLVQHLLTGKKRLKGFDTRWRTFCISDLFRLENRHIKWNENSNYNLISIRRRYGGIFFRGSFHANEIQVKKLKEIRIGDFLISKRQVSHGAWAVVSSEFDSFLVSNEYDCLSINDNSVLSGAFWQWYIRQPKMTNYAFLDSIGVHIEKLIFHYKQFRKRQVKIPSLKEQQAITSVLEEADKELMLYHSQLNILKEQKKGLMQKLLTGQIRVNI